MTGRSFGAEPVSVLVVDDSDFFRELVAGELEKRSGIDPIPHADGTTIVETIDARPGVDCVVTDYEMPAIDGLELLERIRTEHQDVPVIMLTGQGDEDVASEAIKRGASDYITKTTVTEDGEIDLIANRIRQAVYQQRAREALAEKREQLRRQNDRLEFLNHLVRHDIANELTVALGNLHGVEPAESTETELESAIDAIENAAAIADAAGEMVEVFAQGDDLDREPIALVPLLEREVANARSTYPEADIGIDGEIPDVAVRANEMLESVVRNLLSNAVQHNDSDEPRVRVMADADEKRATVRVADNGPGVPPSAREAIFEYDERSRESDGMGIGLHLVATLVDAYDGSVRVEDNDPRGTVFVVELPLAATS